MQIVTIDDSMEFHDKLSRIPYIVVLISIPVELGKRIQKIQTQLKTIDDRQIYYHIVYFHITIKQIGWLGEEIKEGNLSEIKEKAGEVASSIEPFSLSLKGLRVWPSVIYADVLEGRDQVRDMHLRVRRELRGYTVTESKYEGEVMHAHVTIANFAARDAERLIQEVKAYESTEIGRMRVDKIRLIKTIPSKMSKRSLEEASFDEIASFSLGHA